MLRWLDAMGFALAPSHVVDCAVRGGAYAPERDDAVSVPVGDGPAHEIDFGGRPGNDFERLARDIADVRAMRPDDLADIVRIDRDITGRDRERLRAAQAQRDDGRLGDPRVADRAPRRRRSSAT